MKEYERILALIPGLCEPQSNNAFDKIDNIYHYLDNIIAAMPGSVYWMNKNFIYIGCNNSFANLFRLKSRHDIVGKTYKDLYDDKSAAHYKAADAKVLSTGKALSLEEPLYYPDGSKNIYLSNKLPLFDKNHRIIGMLGISIDITNRQKIKELELNNANQYIKLRQQEEFTKAAEKVVHDIRSPLTAILMMIKDCTQLPESIRTALRESSESISNITENFLTSWKNVDQNSQTPVNKVRPEPTLVALSLLEVLTSKRYQYQNKSLNFVAEINRRDYFITADIETSSLKRTLSNLIDNSVDAYDNKPGTVSLSIDSQNKNAIIISIKDNGKGIDKKTLDSIRNDTKVTANKTSGHGIGLMQVRDSLKTCCGSMSIESQLEKGTIILITLQSTKLPDWLATDIKMRPKDTILIVDDDESIHMAWNQKLASYNVKTKHFKIAQDALDFIQIFPKKENLLLLSDFEFVNQQMTGIDLIYHANLTRTILVTSYFNKAFLQKEAISIGASILPKQLAHEVHLIMENP